MLKPAIFYHRFVAENLRLENLSGCGTLRGSSVAVKKQDVKPALKRKAAKKPFDMRLLRQMALWAVTAACAVLLAVLTSRSEAGSERVAAVMASLRGQAAPPPFDARVETRKLANGLRGLGSDNDQLRSRLTAVERHIDDVTGSLGSLKKQIDAVKAEAEAPRPADTPPAPATPDVSGSTVAPAPAPSAAAPPPPLPPAAPPARVQTPSPAKPAAPGASSSSVAPKQYGVDIGTAVSVAALRARWTEMRAAHPQLLQGLTPTAFPRDAQPNRSELRLVLGPLPNSDAATHLCTSLAPYRISCQPTGFDDQHVALQ